MHHHQSISQASSVSVVAVLASVVYKSGRDPSLSIDARREKVEEEAEGSLDSEMAPLLSAFEDVAMLLKEEAYSLLILAVAVDKAFNAVDVEEGGGANEALGLSNSDTGSRSRPKPLRSTGETDWLVEGDVEVQEDEEEVGVLVSTIANGDILDISNAFDRSGVDDSDSGSEGTSKFIFARLFSR